MIGHNTEKRLHYYKKLLPLILVLSILWGAVELYNYMSRSVSVAASTIFTCRRISVTPIVVECTDGHQYYIKPRYEL